VGKLTFAASILAAAVIGVGAGWVLRSRKEALRGPSPSRPESKPLSDASCLADERASRGSFMTPEPKPAEASTPAGRVKGRVFLPWQERKKTSFAYALYAFTPDGKVEGPKNVVNTDQFEWSPVTPGRRAILFYPLLENLSFPYQVVDVPSSGLVEISLRPTIPFLLSGRVVDANGRGVGGVMVIAHESIQLANDLYLQGRPSEAAVVEKTSDPVISPASPTMEDIFSTYVRIDPLAGKLSRGVTTDAKGHFSLPVASPIDPVSLTINRGKADVLKEETVLPGGGAVRIVVPTQ